MLTLLRLASPARSAALLLTACAADTNVGPHAGIDPSIAGPASSPPDGGLPGNSGEALQVGLRVTQGACPDTCVTLRAEVSNGVPPYTYSWSNPSLNGPGPHVLCDAAGTVTTLDVHDSAGSGEFLEPQVAHASYARSADGCAPNTPAPPVPSCPALRISLAPGLDSVPILSTAADVDARGNLYVAGTSSDNVIVLAPGTRLDTREPVAGGTRTFLAKYDAGCTLAWSQWLGDAHRPTELGSLDVDEDGQIAVTTVAVGDAYAAEGGGGEATSDVTLWSIDPAGSISWSVFSPEGAALHFSMGGNGVRWGSDGSLAVMGLNRLCRELDAGNDLAGQCVARIARSGVPLFARGLPLADGAAVALDAAGALYASGLSINGGQSATTSPADDLSFAYIVKYTPSGELAWRHERPRDLSRQENWIQGFVHAATSGEATGIWYGASPEGDQTRIHSWTIAADGSPREPVSYSPGLGSSDLHFAGAPDGTIASATRLEPSHTTQVQHWNTRGQGDTVRTLSNTRAGGVQDLQITPQGLHVLVEWDALPDVPQVEAVRIETF